MTKWTSRTSKCLNDFKNTRRLVGLIVRRVPLVNVDHTPQRSPSRNRIPAIKKALLVMVKKQRSINTPGSVGPIGNLPAQAPSRAPPGSSSIAFTAGEIAGASPGHTALKSAPTALLPVEVEGGDWTVVIFALMIFLAPAMGVPNEEMLQDTLKSIVVSFGTVFAGLLFFWHQRMRRDALRWHGLMWLPLALMLYALGSMVWSHTYLGGVEAIRWFVFSLILWLGINTFSRARVSWLVEGIHWGAVIASLWTALQFWIDLAYFPQGPNPASTFVNRNFFAEYVVCTLPFSAYLLAQAKRPARISLMAFTLGLNMLALMMTGTRGALMAMWILLAAVLPVTAILYRKQFSFFSWDAGKRLLAAAVLLATVVGFGLVPTTNSRLLKDAETIGVGTTAFDRAFILARRALGRG